jgi:hypothetical protein
MPRRFRTFAACLPAVCALAGGACGPVAAQGLPAPGIELQPLTVESVQFGLQRPLAASVVAPQLVGSLDLKDQKFYIAEYQVLVEVGGDVVLPQRNGKVLGQPVPTAAARVSWQTQADVRALQPLVDYGWADLRARMQAAGLPMNSARELLGVTPTVYEPTATASTADHVVMVEAPVGDRQHRYLVLAPTGMPIVPRPGKGINPGNVLARVTHVSQKIDALSLGVAFNLSGQDPAELRASPYAHNAGADEPLGPAIAPWLEVASVPSLPLIAPHVQNQSVRLAESLTLKPEFGRLMASASVPTPTRSNSPEVLAVPLQAALSLGRLVGLVDEPLTPLGAVLELDGPGLSRGLVYGLFSANQAIVNALLAAR